MFVARLGQATNDDFTNPMLCYVQDFGWEGIGYHKVILRSGKIENGRPEFWIGAHVKGKNKNSLGVCLIGTDKFTNEQFLSLKKVLLKWKKKYPNARINKPNK